jgi:hypothetical protein
MDDISVEEESEDRTEDPVPLTTAFSSSLLVSAELVVANRELERDEVIRQRDEAL